ncbi:uncharacterized protein V1516DRAFT_680396 [Lipomyces oligophaga]|uniref:uncharacterized protein n=1 Tax=Lipomyces oligophaga TaxID=45792 RepID=UPI0034CD2F9E
MLQFSLTLVRQTPHGRLSFSMSANEDSMDVDSASQNSFTFSTESSKGKCKTTTNMPVEAEDMLPWIEKYYPGMLDSRTCRATAAFWPPLTSSSSRTRYRICSFTDLPSTNETSIILTLVGRL